MSPTNRRYTQVRDILDQGRAYHRQLTLYYQQLSGEAQRQRVKLLLDHLGSHERNMQEALARYIDGAPEEVLDTWVDWRHREEILGLCEPPPTLEMSVDKVIEAAMALDNCLLGFYKEVVESADAERVREVFRNLIEAEEMELRKLAQDSQQVWDF